MHRTSSIAMLGALVVAAALPPAAAASPLLSGYGGPGQGNQAILGSALVNPPRGGSGGGSGGGSAGSSGGGSGTGSLVAAPQGVEGQGATGGAGKQRSAQGGRRAGKAPHASGPASSAYESLPVSRSADVGSQVLGLSGADFVYLLLACAALVLTAVVTARIARRER
jgi:hypothetical protein